MDTKSTNNQSGSNADPRASIYDEILEKDILDLIGAKGLSDNEKEEIYSKMLDTIMTRVLLKVDSQLTDDDVEEIKKVVEKKDKEAFLKIFKDKGIDIDDIFVQEAALYKVEMVALISQGRTDA